MRILRANADQIARERITPCINISLVKVISTFDLNEVLRTNPALTIIYCTVTTARSVAVVPHYKSVLHCDVLLRPVSAVRGSHAQPAHYLHPTVYSPEDSVLAVQPRARRKSDKELTAVCVGPTVCH